MKLMFDQLRRQARGTPLAPLLSDATVFYNDDAIQQAVAGTIDLEELPSLAPPYEKFFIECRLPLFDALKRMGALITPRVGAMVTVTDISLTRELGWPDNADARWAYTLLLFMENRNTLKIMNLGAANILLDAAGNALLFHATEESQDGYCYFKWNPDFKATLTVQGDDAFVLPMTLVDASMYTIGMLHCHNIGTDVIEPSRAEAHKFERKYGIPMTRYHILKVTGKGAAAGERIGAPTGAHRPLHWARGHFKHYSEDAPLLGKHVGSFYWGATLRGRISAGAVVKDYQVETHKRTHGAAS